MHTLIYLLVLGAAHESFNEAPRRSTRLHPGHSEETRGEALRAACLPHTSIGSIVDTTWGLGIIIIIFTLT